MFGSRSHRAGALWLAWSVLSKSPARFQKYLAFFANRQRPRQFWQRKENPRKIYFSLYPLGMSQPYLNVELEGSDGLLQHLAPLLLCQLHAVHPAAVQLLEQVGAGDAGESKEQHTLAAAQLQGFLGDPPQDLASRQVTQVPGISMGKQVLGIFLPDLKKRSTLLLFWMKTAEECLNVMKPTCFIRWQYLLVAAGTTIFSLQSWPKKNSRSFSMDASLASSTGK